MTEHRFETHEPVDLYVEIGKGSVHVTLHRHHRDRRRRQGRDADEVDVEQARPADQRRSPPASAAASSAATRAPRRRRRTHGSDLAVSTGSRRRRASRARRPDAAHAAAPATCASTTSAGPLLVETGSGDVSVDARARRAAGQERLRRRRGRPGRRRAVVVSTGSGDVDRRARRAARPSSRPAPATSSVGDAARRRQPHAPAAATSSIDRARRGRLTVKGASGDVRVGIPAGVPVWTDITTVSGAIRSDLQGAGQPEDGADHVELRAKTVSGDVVLSQV